LIRHQPGAARPRCELFAEFGMPAGRPPPLLLGADRRDEPFVLRRFFAG
jgi:hypothetical protein